VYALQREPQTRGQPAGTAAELEYGARLHQPARSEQPLQRRTGRQTCRIAEQNLRNL